MIDYCPIVVVLSLFSHFTSVYYVFFHRNFESFSLPLSLKTNAIYESLGVKNGKSNGWLHCGLWELKWEGRKSSWWVQLIEQGEKWKVHTLLKSNRAFKLEGFWELEWISAYMTYILPYLPNKLNTLGALRTLHNKIFNFTWGMGHFGI